jgi:hypothetical protein
LKEVRDWLSAEETWHQFTASLVKAELVESFLFKDLHP